MPKYNVFTGKSKSFGHVLPERVSKIQNEIKTTKVSGKFIGIS